MGKVLDIRSSCTQVLAMPQTKTMELSIVLRKLLITAQTFLPGRIQCRYLQMQQIQAIRQTNLYQSKISFSQQLLAELRWWKEYLLFENSRPLKIRIRYLIIKTDASNTALGVVCKGTRGTWSYKKKRNQANVLVSLQ